MNELITDLKSLEIETLKNLKLSLMLDPDFSLALSMVDYLENEKKGMGKN